jgi:hypothetical protein
MHASTSSLTVALVASATLFASQVEGMSSALLCYLERNPLTLTSRTHAALPMTRSSSSVARRAHIATHHHHDTRASDLLQLGDHAIVVDASSSGNAQAGGIRNSTINLTSISHQNKNKKRSDSTFSGFSRVVRSLFGGSTIRRRSEEALPLTFAPSSSAAASATAPTDPKIAAVNPKGVKRTKRNHASSSKKGRRSSRPRNFGKHPRPATAPITNLKKRAAVPTENPSKSTLVVPVAARYITRQVKRGGATYTEALAQASIYSAAIAALPESTPTASSVLADVAPTVAAYIATLENNRNNSGSPYSGSPLINAPDGSYGNAAAARARKFSSSSALSISWASIASSTLSSEAVPTTTVTTPLVSVDSNGITWVQAATAAFATPGPLSTSTTSSSVINPKATLAVSSPSSSAAAPMATASASSSSSALPTSPPPSTATLRR